MADFYVPIATNLLTDLNQQIAAGPPKPDLSFIGNALENYKAGGDIGQQIAQRDMFKNGIPMQNGMPDYGAISKQLLQIGGASAIPQAINLGNAQIGRDVLQNTGVLPPSVPPSSANAIPSNRPTNNPGNIENGTFAQSIPGYQQGNGRFASFATPEAGAAAEDKLISSYGQKGIVTPNAIAARWAPAGDGANNPQQYGAFIASQLGVDPNTPLDLTNPQVRQRVAAAINRFEGNGSAPQTTPQAAQPAPQVAQNGPAAAPQAAPQAQPPYAQQSPTPTQNVPAQPTEALANAYENRANYFYQQAKGLSFVNPTAAAQAKAQGDMASQQALAIRKSLLESAQPTPEQKNANASGVPSPLALDRAKKIQEGNVTAGQKEYEGIQAQATQFERDLKPYLDVSRSIINDPKFYSGIGGNFSLDINRVKAALGDKNAAVLQEALQKVTAASVLAQINNQRAQLQEAGGNSSRIFRQQVDLVEKAAPALSNTPAGNRFLVEVSSRMGDLSSKVAQMAREYKSQNGTLDSGFDQKLADYMKQNPVFTEQEMTRPETLGAPSVPPSYANDRAGFVNWVNGMGLKSGDPIRLPNGKIKKIP